jgi:hypothetical protein
MAAVEQEVREGLPKGDKHEDVTNEMEYNIGWYRIESDRDQRVEHRARGSRRSREAHGSDRASVRLKRLHAPDMSISQLE